MSKRISYMVKIGALSLASLAFLAGCSSATEQANEQIHDLAYNIEESAILINEIQVLEDQVQNDLETVVAEDESMKSLAATDSKYISNISERENRVGELNKLAKDIEKNADSIAKIDQEETDIDAGILDQTSQEAQSYGDLLKQFTEAYPPLSKAEKDFAKNIASDDATYNLFNELRKEVNDRHIETAQALSEIQSTYASLKDKTSRATIAAQTAASQEQGDESNQQIGAQNTERPSASLEGISGEEIILFQEPLLDNTENLPQRFYYDTGYEFAYPEDGVKGLYLSGKNVNNPEVWNKTMEDMRNTKLNAIVIDVKDDFGNINIANESDNPYVVASSKNPAFDVKKAMSDMEENQVYPIARITTFKDSILAEEHPELSFKKKDGSVWKAANGEAFINPYLKEVWDYNIAVAIEAAKAGFKEVQFDYVRFPEGFETFSEDLVYDRGDYEPNDEFTDMNQRVNAITDFVAYTQDALAPYGIDVSVDVFGYTAVVGEASGIGQNFREMSQEADIISSMIYPSHWGPQSFGYAAPDLEPYGVVDAYLDVEQQVNSDVKNPALSRPWLQDFTAAYLGSGMYKEYGPEEIQAQIDAVYDSGQQEYLLWNARNTYTTEGVEF